MTTQHDIALTWDDGREETVVGDEDEPILAAADAAGVSLPFGCLTGACGTCVGQLQAGRVAYDRPPRALKPRHLDAGFVLCCLARPTTDCRLTVGARVQSRLVTNPWG